MDLERVENSINDKFKNFEPAVDDAMIWDRIEGNLPSKKRRKPFWLFALFLLPVAYFLFLNGNSEEAIFSQVGDNKIESKVEKNLLVKGNGEEDGQEKSQPLLSGLQNENETLASDKILISESLSTSSSNTFAQAQETKDKISKPNVNTTTINKSVVKNTDGRIEGAILQNLKSDDVELVQEFNTSKSKDLDSFDKRDPDQKELPAIDNEKEASGGEVKSIVEVITAVDGANTNTKDKIDTDTRPQSSSINKAEENEEKGLLNDKNALDNTVSIEEKSTQPLLGNSNDGHEAEAVKAKKLRDYNVSSLSFTSGIYLANRIYTTTSNGALAAAISEKEDVEQQLETLQFGLDYNFRIGQRLAIGVGVRQWTLSEKSVYTTENNYSDLIEVMTGLIHHVDGTTTPINSMVPINFNETVTHTRYQTHSSWSVPVKAYYAIGYNSRKRIELGFGYEHSFAGKHKGYELVEDKMEYLITDDIDENYKDRGGNYLLASLDMDFKIKKSIEFTAGLEGKYGLNGFNTETALFQKKYHFLGAFAGLNYTF